MGQGVIMCSAVCSFVSHSKTAVKPIPYLCISEHNSPMPVQRWLSLTHASLGELIPSGVWSSLINVWSREEFSCHSILIYILPIVLHWCLTWWSYSAVSVQQAQMGVLILVPPAVHKVETGAFHIGNILAPKCGKLETVWLFGSKAQLVKCLLFSQTFSAVCTYCKGST